MFGSIDVTQLSLAVSRSYVWPDFLTTSLTRYLFIYLFIISRAQLQNSSAPSHSSPSRSAHQPSPPAFLLGSSSTVEKLSELVMLLDLLGLNEDLKKTFSVQFFYPFIIFPNKK